MNLVSSGVCSLFKTTSVASLLAWNTCNMGGRITLLKSPFVVKPLMQPLKGVGKFLLNVISLKFKHNQWVCCLGLFEKYIEVNVAPLGHEPRTFCM